MCEKVCSNLHSTFNAFFKVRFKRNRPNKKKMKHLRILMVMACAITSFGLNVDDEDPSSFVDDLPVLSAETVFDYITKMMHSPVEKFKEMGTDTLQNLKSQMDDKSKQYAKLSLNGIRFAVNMGASGSALRTKNEKVLTHLWNYFVSLFYNILSWFGIGSHKKTDATYSLEIHNTDEFYEEDAVFMKTTLLQQLCEIDTIIYERRAITKYINDNSITISENIKDKIERENIFELEYKNNLEKSIQFYEERMEAANEQIETQNQK